MLIDIRPARAVAERRRQRYERPTSRTAGAVPREGPPTVVRNPAVRVRHSTSGGRQQRHRSPGSELGLAAAGSRLGGQRQHAWGSAARHGFRDRPAGIAEGGTNTPKATENTPDYAAITADYAANTRDHAPQIGPRRAPARSSLLSEGRRRRSQASDGWHSKGDRKTDSDSSRLSMEIIGAIHSFSRILPSSWEIHHARYRARISQRGSPQYDRKRSFQVLAGH